MELSCKTVAEICQERKFLLLQIVWDQEKKKWTNVDGDGDNESSDLPPPPKAAGSEGPATGPSGSNVYRLSGPGKGKTYFNKSTVEDALQ